MARHIAMVQNTTKGNRGYEVSIGHFIFLISGVVSAITTAHFLETSSQATGLKLALVSLVAGTLCLLLSSRIVRQHSIRKFVQECRKVVSENPYLARRIISQSLFDMPSFTMAALMHLMGISPTVMASIIVARLLVMFFLAPLIGTIAQKHRKHGYGIGLGIVGLGWLVLALAPDQSGAFFLCSLLYAIGMSFASTSLMSGLYEMQSYGTMMWSELFLAIGRSAGLLFLVPLMFYDAQVYLFSLSALSFLIFIFNRRWVVMYTNETP